MEMGRARRRLEEVLQAYVDKSRVAEEHRCDEHKAVILLQCAWRRRMVYKMLRKWNCAVIHVQRVYRGHLGRERYQFIARARDTALRMAYFKHRATLIQTRFRGYYSRKYVHSFYARKEFLLDAMAKATDVKQHLSDNYKEQCDYRYKEAARKTQEEMHKFMENNHCLLGTEAIKGVYFSPCLSVLGQPNQVEAKIKEARKMRDCTDDVKRSRRIKKQPPPELWRHMYITTVGPYKTRFESLRQEEKQKRLSQYADSDFATTFKDRTNVFKGRTLRLQTEYSGLRRKKSKEEGWKKISEKPFFVSIPPRRRFSCGGK